MKTKWQQLDTDQRLAVKRILTSALLLLIGFLWPEKTSIKIGWFLAAYLVAGWPVLKAAGQNLVKGQLFDENFLMSLATLGLWPSSSGPKPLR
ncbi:hypothetical protein ACLOBS_06175 [Limosilactobacillus mucosae]|uniref:hypothetical protein n=1 Tax=Limosilactobacillus mucosae TaxID=97478 RepID=UPI003EC073D4